MVDVKRWRYWQLFDKDGSLAWLAVSRPDAHRRRDRVTLWTLMPAQQRLIANWFVSVDHQLPEGERRWVHDSITGWDFCDAANSVPEPTKEELARLARPEALLTIDEITDIPLLTITGKRDLRRILDERAALLSRDDKR